jgi:hypothetical protein
MTLIVWDGKTLAAGRCVVKFKERMETQRIFRHSDGRLIGWIALEHVGKLWEKWMDDHCPELDYDSSYGFFFGLVGIEIFPDGTIIHHRRAETKMVIGSSYIIGSHRKIALGALSLGADARRSIEAVLPHVKGYGSEVDELCLVV